MSCHRQDMYRTNPCECRIDGQRRRPGQPSPTVRQNRGDRPARPPGAVAARWASRLDTGAPRMVRWCDLKPGRRRLRLHARRGGSPRAPAELVRLRSDDYACTLDPAVGRAVSSPSASCRHGLAAPFEHRPFPPATFASAAVREVQYRIGVPARVAVPEHCRGATDESTVVSRDRGLRRRGGVDRGRVRRRPARCRGSASRPPPGFRRATLDPDAGNLVPAGPVGDGSTMVAVGAPADQWTRSAPNDQ